jgi:outer membrane protein assembly factor BamB
MRKRWARLLVLGIVLGMIPSTDAAEDAWPEFRGPTQQGHAPGTDPPLKWFQGAAPDPGRQIKFKTEIPGRGWSSPVVLGDQIWMTTATDDGRSLRAICCNKDSGKITQDVEVFHVDSPESINAFNSYASPSPLIEKGRVYVCFGSEGNACLDTATGKPLWKSQELRVDHMEGPGSSPVIVGDLYILNCDGVDAQFVAALNKGTGKLVWRKDRTTPFPATMPPMRRKAYGTPIVVHFDGKDQLISPAARRVVSYDPLTGTEIWHVDLEPPAYNVVPRPIFADGIVYLCTGYDNAQLWAVGLDAKSVGDVTASHVLWKCNRGAPLKPSPLVIGSELYFVSDTGIARCIDAKTGTQIWQARIGAAFTASPVDANGRVYFFGEGGRSIVLQAGREFKVLADNYLDGGGCLATPAFSGKAIFLRSRTHLYRIEN